MENTNCQIHLQEQAAKIVDLVLLDFVKLPSVHQQRIVFVVKIYVFVKTV